MKRLACIISALLLWSCADKVSGGPGSETTNGIAYIGNGAVASYARIAIRSVDHTTSVDNATNALVNADFYADAKGRFSFETPEGEYRLTIVHGGSAHTGLYTTHTTKGDTSIGSINLEPTATLGGYAEVPENCEFVWVGVRGMDMLVRSDSMGRFQLSQLPSNNSLQVYFLRGDDNTVYDDLSVKLSPNEAEVIDLQPDTLEGKVKFVAVVNGKAASYASLAIRKSDAFVEKPRVNNVVAEVDAYADKDGMFAIDSLKSGDYRLTVMQSGAAYSKVLSAKQIASLDTVELQETSNYMSRVTLHADEKYAWVGVYGLDVMTKTNEEGVFSLPMLPSNDTLEIYVLDTKDSLYVTRHITLSKGSADFDNPSVVLQDFEKDTSNWYFNVDSIGSKIVSKSFETDSARKSKVFHGKYSLIATNNFDAWVVTGSLLRVEGWNLSSLDSISFYAKGSGEIRVSLENWDRESEVAGLSLKASSDWKKLSSSKWTRFVVKSEELCYNSQDTKSCYTTWNSLKDDVRQLNFFVRNGTEFYLDDIELYGALF